MYYCFSSQQLWMINSMTPFCMWGNQDSEEVKWLKLPGWDHAAGMCTQQELNEVYLPGFQHSFLSIKIRTSATLQPGIVLGTFLSSGHLILPTTMRCGWHYFHFTDRETEAEPGQLRAYFWVHRYSQPRKSQNWDSDPLKPTKFWMVFSTSIWTLIN